MGDETTINAEPPEPERDETFERYIERLRGWLIELRAVAESREREAADGGSDGLENCEECGVPLSWHERPCSADSPKTAYTVNVFGQDTTYTGELNAEFTSDVESCARCGGDHDDVPFFELAGHDKYEWWGQCPETYQPILNRSAEDEVGMPVFELDPHRFEHRGTHVLVGISCPRCDAYHPKLVCTEPPVDVLENLPTGPRFHQVWCPGTGEPVIVTATEKSDD